MGRFVGERVAGDWARWGSIVGESVWSDDMWSLVLWGEGYVLGMTLH